VFTARLDITEAVSGSVRKIIVYEKQYQIARHQRSQPVSLITFFSRHLP
jgi:hypothetical protein